MMVCPCRNALLETFYRDICGIGEGGGGGGGWFCSEQEAREERSCNVRKSATREGLTKRNDHVNCVTVPSFS